DRRLREVELLSGLREGAVACHRLDGAQMTELHGWIVPARRREVEVTILGPAITCRDGRPGPIRRPSARAAAARRGACRPAPTGSAGPTDVRGGRKRRRSAVRWWCRLGAVLAVASTSLALRLSKQM